MVPWICPSPHPKWNLNRFGRFCTVHCFDRQTAYSRHSEVYVLLMFLIFNDSSQTSSNVTLIDTLSIEKCLIINLQFIMLQFICTFSALTLLVGRQEGYPAC